MTSVAAPENDHAAPETDQEFEERKEDYIQKKLVLTKELKDLVGKQDAVLAKIAELRKPVKGPPKDFYYVHREEQDRVRNILDGKEQGECYYFLGINGSIEPKPGVRRTESIRHHSWLYDSMEMIKDAQSYLIHMLFDPRYKTEAIVEARRKRKMTRYSDPDSESEDSW